MKTVVTFFTLGAFLFSCSTHEETHKPGGQAGRDHTTDVFRYYLAKAFGDSIGQEKQLYILVPKNGCKGCREGALAVLHNEILRSGKTNIIYIFSPSVNFIDSLVKPCGVKIDSSRLIDGINLPVSNICFVKTENGKVTSLVSLRSETQDSIGYYLNQ